MRLTESLSVDTRLRFEGGHPLPVGSVGIAYACR
jgi:hypothetical protein